MSDWVKLTAHTHATAAWQRVRGYRFAAADHHVAVLAVEGSQLLPWYPLAFLPREEGQHDLVALLGFEPASNLYLNPQGKWLAPYIPSHYRGYPFRLDADGAICFDESSGLVCAPGETNAEPFYQNGQLAPFVSRVAQFLASREQGLNTTRLAIDQLAAAELLQPWPITWQHNGQTHTVTTPYQQVDEARLQRLKPVEYAALAATGALGLAYLQLFSKARLAELQARDKHHRRATAPPDFDLPADLFDDENGSLRFD